MILHAPLGLIALLFGASMLVISPQGGLSDAPHNVADRALAGTTLMALAN